MLRRMTAGALAALAIAIGGVAPARAVEGVRALGPVPGSVRFEVSVPAPVLVPVDVATNGGTSAMRVLLDGWSASEAPGEAALPVRVVTVAVPPTGAVSVTASGSGEVVHDGVELATNAPLGDAAPIAPPGIARLVEVGWMRHQRIARIELHPARWDATTRRLVTYASLEVAVGVATVTPAAAPASDAFEELYRQALVNYEQGRDWRGVAPVTGAEPRTRSAARLAQAAAVPDTSVFIGHRWVKLSIRRSGFYRVPYSAFRNYPPFSTESVVYADSVRLFTWGGSTVLPESDYCDTCGYREVAIGVKNNDELMNANDDAIYFYALGPSDWADRFESNQPDTVFLTHPYDTRNVYFLGLSTAEEPIPGQRRRIGQRDVSPAGSVSPTPPTFPERVHYEQDNTYEANSWPGGSTYAWEKWFWTKIREGGRFTITGVDAPGADTTLGARLRLRMWSLNVGTCVDQRQFVSPVWNGTTFASIGWRGYTGMTWDVQVPTFKQRANALQLTADLLGCDNEIGLSWLDVRYARRYRPVGDRLEFRPPAGGGSFRYQVGPFGGTGANLPRLFDISDTRSPVELLNFTYTPTDSGNMLAFQGTDDDRRRYAALPDTAFLAIAGADITPAAATSRDNLRSRTQQADYLVVTYDAFELAADTLATWRRAHNGFRTKTVPISAIYDQFSGGRTDPTAIRNFMRAAYYNWDAAPAYVTFLGDASYDFKNVLGRAEPGLPGAPLPTYENGFDAGRQYTTDDWLLNVDDPITVVPDFLGGRLPVPDAASAMDVVRNKVLWYERSAPLGLYRDRIMFVADDDHQGALPDGLRWRHVSQTKILDSLWTPPVLDRDYVYLHLFPTNLPDYSKPEARDTIVSHLEHEGVAVLNFIGHGSPFKIADESALTAGDADNLSNATKLPLFLAASCDVGRYSDPVNTSMGEKLVINTRGGAIGVISATELAYSGQNAVLNQALFAALFARLPDGSMSGWVAEALTAGKGGSTNSQKYQLMGDAALRLNLPRYWADIQVEDEAGTDTTTIRKGSRMTFTGRVLTGPGGAAVPFEGTADVLVEDSRPVLGTFPPCTTSFCVPEFDRATFPYFAGPVYRGTVDVHGGVFSGRFVVPLEARPGVRGRIRVYLAGASGAQATDGAGDLRLLVDNGTPPTVDDRGPSIRLSFPNGASRVGPTAALRIDIADSSGVLITGHTPQNGIIVTIDGSTTSRVDVTDGFRYAPGSYQSGTVLFALPNLAEGSHVVTVSAADNLAAGLSAGQHRSQASIAFEVVINPPFRVVDAYLFPDPVASRGALSGGRFVVDTEGGAVETQLRMFTVSGRLIRVLKASGEGQLQLHWDGLDAEGQALANGVYLFKVVVRSAGSSDGGPRTAEAMGRFVIVNP